MVVLVQFQFQGFVALFQGSILRGIFYAHLTRHCFGQKMSWFVNKQLQIVQTQIILRGRLVFVFDEMRAENMFDERKRINAIARRSRVIKSCITVVMIANNGLKIKM